MALSLTILSLALLLSRCLSSISGENQEQFTFAKCEPNREKCRDCYFALVKSLLGRADNVFNLTNAFSPPGKSEPEYVIVTYRFDNYTLTEEKNWFWSKSVAYYLFSMNTFQVLSLFLSKGNQLAWHSPSWHSPLHRSTWHPRPDDNQRYQQHVRVTLNATECWGVNNDYMTLLTQKLHIYARAQSITPQLDNSYTTLALNNETFDSIVGADLIKITLACPIVVNVLAFIIIVLLLVVYTRRDQGEERLPLIRSSKATLLSLATINGSYATGIITFDLCYAVINREQSHPIHGHGKIGEPYNILYNIPVVVFIFDLLASILIAIASTAIRPIHSCSSGKLNDITDNQYYKLALISTIGVIISLLNHSPYMVMAYFIDPYYTTGLLLFYAFIVISWFSLLEFIFNSLLRKLQTISTMFTGSNVTVIRTYQQRCVFAYCALICVLFFSYMILAYAVLLFLWEIPIKPVFIAIGGFALYKLVSRRKRLWNHQNSVPETEEYEALRQDRPQDAEQQPLLNPQ